MADRLTPDWGAVVPLLERLCAAVEALDRRFAPPAPAPKLTLEERLRAEYGETLTETDLAGVYRVDTSKIRKLVEEHPGHLGATKVGGLLRVPVGAVVQMLGGDPLPGDEPIDFTARADVVRLAVPA